MFIGVLTDFNISIDLEWHFSAELQLRNILQVPHSPAAARADRSKDR